MLEQQLHIFLKAFTILARPFTQVLQVSLEKKIKTHRYYSNNDYKSVFLKAFTILARHVLAKCFKWA